MSKLRGMVKRFRASWLLLICLTLFLDRGTKHLVLRKIARGEVIEFSSYLNLVCVKNRGAAFSLLADYQHSHCFFISLAFLLLSYLIYVLLSSEQNRGWSNGGYSLIIGGAIGNLIDRLIYHGVVDFLDFHLHGWHWPAFNLADSAICLGCLLVLVDSFRYKKV